ncbi:hypothetical protein BDC45DRAFT_491920 [Circinella umbellata]|nr:hypothetical protein BDC45DRAFT_491920 [Circinella umbellata]
MEEDSQSYVNCPLINFEELSHRMDWGSTEDGTVYSFYATWADIGKYCHYCHETTHTMNDCLLQPAR